MAVAQRSGAGERGSADLSHALALTAPLRSLVVALYVHGEGSFCLCVMTARASSEGAGIKFWPILFCRLTGGIDRVASTVSAWTLHRLGLPNPERCFVGYAIEFLMAPAKGFITRQLNHYQGFGGCGGVAIVSVEDSPSGRALQNGLFYGLIWPKAGYASTA